HATSSNQTRAKNLKAICQFPNEDLKFLIVVNRYGNRAHSANRHGSFFPQPERYFPLAVFVEENFCTLDLQNSAP
ncbi:MAG TPA: hypothetical protein VN836_12805, partial [Verrucomicrobiae bacterium]|nr:hypothetical protein [Verrucomicrobiae bacterium]